MALGLLAVDGAANRVGSAKDFLDSALGRARHRLEPHLARDLENLVHRQVARVLDVLDLLAIALRLGELLDQQRRRRRHDLDLRLTVLRGQLNGDAQTIELERLLGNVVTNLLGRLAMSWRGDSEMRQREL